MDYRALANIIFLLLLGGTQWVAPAQAGPTEVTTPRDPVYNIATDGSWDSPVTGKGERLYQGDMVLTDEQWQAHLQRKAITDERYRWPKSADGLINIDYRYADDIVSKPGVQLGLTSWETSTCIRFHEVPAAVAKPHLIFKTNDLYCNSNVGQIYSKNGQDVNLMPSCFSDNDVVVHELGHALGLHHEQSRSDRDDYLYVMFENVVTGMEHNFNKEVTNNYGLPYDYSSVMQYFPSAFSKNGLDTIASKDPLAQPLIKDSKGLSFMDKKIINLMYKCTDTWLAACGRTTDPCQNQGYTNSACACECPAGTTGTNCETLVMPYVEALVAAKSPGSKRVTTPGVITSPGYPTPVSLGTNNVVSIEAPECHTVKLTFDKFNFYPKSTLTTGALVCWFMTLEIRRDDPPIYGTQYCGTEITEKQVFESVGRSMALIFTTKTVSNTYTGYSATVEFVPMTTTNCSSVTPGTTTTATGTGSAITTTPPTITTTPPTITTTPPTITTTPPIITTTPPTITTTPPTITTTPPTITTTPPTITTTPPTVTTTPTTTTSTAAPSPGRIINSGVLPIIASINNGLCSLISSPISSIYFYRSPKYPSPYTNGQRCTIWFNTTEPRYLKVTPLILELGSSDMVDLFSAYKTTTALNQMKVNTEIVLPTSSSRLTFQSASTGGRFNFRVQVVNTGCHQLIELAAGSTGTLSIPANYPAGTVCEWWLRAPKGRKVQVAFSRFFIGGSTCLRDSVVIDTIGDSRYVSEATRYCGGNIYSPGTVVSTDNALNILVNGQYGNYLGLEATYKVV